MMLRSQNTRLLPLRIVYVNKTVEQLNFSVNIFDAEHLKTIEKKSTRAMK